MKARFVGYKLPSIFQKMFVFPDCQFHVANAMPSQLIRLRPTYTV